MRPGLQQAIAALALLMALVAPAQAGRRVALVVGNAAYQHADPLANPVLDARTMRRTLEGLGFEVIYQENTGKRQLERLIGRFAAASREAEVALAYYAGHGSTFGDTSYLVPVDAEYRSLEGMPHELVPIEALLAELRQARGVRIAILDACRDNASERALKRTRGGSVSRGLAPLPRSEGLIVAYATQFGSVAADGPAGQNSPFTGALAAVLPTPGLDIKQVFFKVGAEVAKQSQGSQRPEISVSFYDAYTLVPIPAVPTPAAETGILTFIATLEDRVVLTRLLDHALAAVREAARQRLDMLTPGLAGSPPTAPSSPPAPSSPAPAPPRKRSPPACVPFNGGCVR